MSIFAWGAAEVSVKQGWEEGGPAGTFPEQTRDDKRLLAPGSPRGREMQCRSEQQSALCAFLTSVHETTGAQQKGDMQAGEGGQDTRLV